MPSGGGAFDRDETVALLEERGALARPCSRCGVSQWRVGEKLSIVDGFDRDSWELDIAYPAAMVLVPVVCGRCGHTRRHDWSVLTGRPIPWP